MKPIHVTFNHWPSGTPIRASNNPNTQGPAMAVAPMPAGSLAGLATRIKGILPAAPTRWLAGLPSNVFGDLIVGAIAQVSVAKSWLSKTALFLPGLILLMSLIIVILTSIVLWPYGLFQQAAEGLWLYLEGLQARYQSSSKPSEKVAIALTMGAIGLADIVLAVIALPIFLGRFYLQWVALAPVTNTAISAPVVAGIALFLALIVPILVCCAIAVILAVWLD